MKHLVLKFLFLAALTAGGSAQAVTCNVTATSVPSSTPYVPGTATKVTGTISITCTKQAGDVAQPYIYIGISRPAAGRVMTRQGGSQTLTYEIYHDAGRFGIWNMNSGVAAASTSFGGVFYRMGSNPSPQNVSFPYYLEILASQTGKPAGIYNDLAVSVSVADSMASGAMGLTLASTSFSVSATIQSTCYFSSAPTPLTINYTSFTATTATGSSAFQLNCILNTIYSLAIGPPSTGTLLGVNYTLSTSATSGTGTGSGQNFTVNGSAAAGQSGTCTSASCSNSQTHTVIVAF